MQLRANDVLGHRFRLERLLGEGGMGMVWSATDLSSTARVALKFLRAGTFTEAAKKRFFREARASMAVQHPNVVRVHELLTAPDGSPLMVMDLLEGESLGERLAKRHRLSLRETADILVPVVSAIGSAHAKGIVHRDLKPDNIFVCKIAGADDPRVLDFGIAKLTAKEGEAMATAGLTSTGAILGTPYYMSPEQVFADKTIDQRADVWSIGVILYECLSGKKPMGGDSIGALLHAISTGERVPLRVLEPALPGEILDMCDAMLTVDRTKRPNDLRVVCDVLARYSSKAAIPFGEATMDATIPFDETIPAEPMSLESTDDGLVKSSAGAQPRRGPLVAVAAVLVAGAVGGGAWFSRGALKAAPAASSTPLAATAAQPTSAPAVDTAPSASSTAASTPAPSTAASAPAPSTSGSASASASVRARTPLVPRPRPSESARPAPLPSGPPPQPAVQPPGVASVNPYH